MDVCLKACTPRADPFGPHCSEPFKPRVATAELYMKITPIHCRGVSNNAAAQRISVECVTKPFTMSGWARSLWNARNMGKDTCKKAPTGLCIYDVLLFETVRRHKQKNERILTKQFPLMIYLSCLPKMWRTAKLKHTSTIADPYRKMRMKSIYHCNKNMRCHPNARIWLLSSFMVQSPCAIPFEITRASR